LETKLKKWLQEMEEWSKTQPNIDLENDPPDTYIQTKNKLEDKIKNYKIQRDNIIQNQ